MKATRSPEERMREAGGTTEHFGGPKVNGNGRGRRTVPLYGLDRLSHAAPGARVILCDGEKQADAVMRMFPDRVGMSWMGGATADLSPLKGFQVLIWPAADPLSRKTAAQLAAKLPDSRVIDTKGLPKGFNAADLEQLADAVPQEWLRERLPLEANLQQLHDFDLTEDGIALAFAAKHRDDLRYDHDLSRWYQWNGQAWRKERTQLAFSWARAICRQFVSMVGAGGGNGAWSTLTKAATAAAVERFAQSDRAFAVTSEIWNRDPWLLGTPGGTVDLRTGKLRPAAQADLISKLTAVAPAETADCPQWLKFLDEATCGDKDLQNYLQRWFGYSLTGVTIEHALLFLWGPGGNGKGTLLSTVFSIMGDYAVNAAIDTFVVTRGDKHTTDIAMLAGARLVITTEVDEGRAWDEARIKSLTGGDPITARFMRSDNVTFFPQFKLAVSGNHKPSLKSVDDAMKRRVNLVNFLFKAAVVNKKIQNELRDEWPGILRWMIQGCSEWQRSELNPPEVVTEATRDYFQAQDHFGRWLAECCVLDPGLSLKPSQALTSFQNFRRQNGVPDTDNTKLRGMIEKTPGLRYVTINGTQLVRGIGLKAPSGGWGVEGG